ncbi:MAG: hypothetical protein ACYDD1_13800 [Caulobacteraceae bacterium]
MTINLRRLAAAALTATLLAGCASSPALVDNLPNGRVQGDADHVSVQGGRWEALPLAVAHCARYGLSASFDRLDGDRSVFKCVKGG